MNPEEALLSLQAAINQMISATATLLSAESVPNGNITIEIGENEDSITILTNGTVFFVPKEPVSAMQRIVKTFSISGYTAIVSPPFDLVGKQICNACNGTGRLP